MKLSKEQLLSIDNLNLGDKLDGLSDERIDNYCEMLFEFVENFPGIESNFKKALFIGDNTNVARVLSELAKNLENIHADGLVRKCDEIKNGIENSDADKLEADLTAFLSIVATLSVDVQMEQHRAAESLKKPKTRKYAVVYADKQKVVLAVDDIPVTLNLLKSVLQDAGYNFYGVTSGVAALDFITKITPDLFVLDIEMPKMSGFELATKLRERGQGAPIVFLTGNTTREYLLKAVQAGAADFIVKPLNVGNVMAKVNRIFGMTDD